MITEQNSTPNSVDEMIDSLKMYLLERQIGIAEVLAKEFADDSSPSPLKQSGYAILSICMAYFEMIEQFRVGRQTKQGESKKFFVSSFRYVYHQTPLSDIEIEVIYSWVRCKMYHSGMTHAGMTKGDANRIDIYLSRHFPNAFYCYCRQIHINPAVLVSDIKRHFMSYVIDLREARNTDLRVNFQCYCEMIGMNAPLVTQTRSSTSGQSTPTRSPWDQG